jgi:hypothetical protein
MTGTVSFFTNCNGCNRLGTSTLTNSQAQFSTSSLPAGSYPVFAAYSGDTNYGPYSTSVNQTVNAIATSTSMMASSSTVQQGATVTLTATITPSQTLSAAPTGTVQFLYSDIGSPLVTVVNNQAQYTTTSLPVGNNAITAKYSGDSSYAGSQSSPVTVTVTGPPTFTISANPTTISVSSPGQSGSTTLTFTSQNGYTGSIPLSATDFTGLPSETTCSFSPTSVSLTGSGMTATATATCQTTAPGAAIAPARLRPNGPSISPRLLVVLAAALLFCVAVLLAGIRAGSKSRGWRVAFAAFALAALVTMGSCGGGSSGPPPPPPNPGTPVGLDSNVKVTFSNAGVTPSPTLSLSINVQ